MSKKSLKPTKTLKDTEEVLMSDYIGGDALDELLSKLVRSVEVAKASRGGLPEKIWMKQQFAVGVNDVTRVLERMPPAVAAHSTHSSSEARAGSGVRRAPLVPLQVPILCLNDNKGSSLRLGQVVNIRTALAIGIKARDSIVNKTIEEVLKGSKLLGNES